MGEYNDTIREYSKMQQKLLDALEIYCEGATRCCNLICGKLVTCYAPVPQEFKVSFNEWLEECRLEINAFAISGRGEVYYKEKTYAKEAVKTAVALHRKAMVYPFLIDSSKKLNTVIEEYFAFLDEFSKMASR